MRKEQNIVKKIKQSICGYHILEDIRNLSHSVLITRKKRTKKKIDLHA